MSVILDINAIVKTSASGGISVSNGSKIDPAKELKGILRKNDDSGSRVSFFRDKNTGELSITPRIARRNVYRDNLKRTMGDAYSEEYADRMADDDYEKALKARYRRLKGIFEHMPKFSKGENYSIAPTDATIPVGNSAYSYGSIDQRIPILFSDWSKGDPLGLVNWRNSKYVSANNFMKLFRKANTDKYVNQHELSHTIAPPSNIEHLVKYIAPGRKDVKDLRYARQPGEMMVGVLNEKARLRGEGRSLDGIGSAWIDEMVRKIKEGWKPGPIPTGKPGRDWGLNIDSLRNIFYEVYQKAHRKGASDIDRMNYELLKKELESDFEQARNSRPNTPSWQRWSSMYNNAYKA